MRVGKVPSFAEMIKDYYDVRGWDESVEPTEETFTRPGLVT